MSEQSGDAPVQAEVGDAAQEQLAEPPLAAGSAFRSLPFQLNCLLCGPQISPETTQRR